MGPEVGCIEATTAAGWNANATSLVLNALPDALTSSVTTPAACGGAMHITSTHPIHRVPVCIIDTVTDALAVGGK